jgi:hypothetical protein
MTTFKTFRLALTAAVLVTATATSRAWADGPAAEPRENAVAAITRAQDPSAVVAAYAQAVAAEADKDEADQAMVERMIELGAPDLAYAQAQALLKEDPDNAKAWAVVAFYNARQAELEDAIWAMIKAVKADPDDAFTQTVAGDLLAWYDSQEQLPGFADRSMQLALAAIRIELRDELAFERAYAGAREAYKGETELAEPEQAAALPEQAQPVEMAAAEPTSVTYRTYQYYDYGSSCGSYCPYYWWPGRLSGGLYYGDFHYRLVPRKTLVVVIGDDGGHRHRWLRKHRRFVDRFDHVRFIHHPRRRHGGKDRDTTIYGNPRRLPVPTARRRPPAYPRPLARSADRGSEQPVRAQRVPGYPGVILVPTDEGQRPRVYVAPEQRASEQASRSGVQVAPEQSYPLPKARPTRSRPFIEQDAPAEPSRPAVPQRLAPRRPEPAERPAPNIRIVPDRPRSAPTVNQPRQPAASAPQPPAQPARPGVAQPAPPAAPASPSPRVLRPTPPPRSQSFTPSGNPRSLPGPTLRPVPPSRSRPMSPSPSRPPRGR